VQCATLLHRTIEFCGLETQTDELGEQSTFVDLWLDEEQGRRVEEQGVEPGSYVDADQVVVVNEGEGEEDAVVRFLLQGELRRLEGAEAAAARAEVAARRQAAGTQPDQASVQAALDMVDMDGTFEYQSQAAGGEVVEASLPAEVEGGRGAVVEGGAPRVEGVGGGPSIPSLSTGITPTFPHMLLTSPTELSTTPTNLSTSPTPYGPISPTPTGTASPHVLTSPTPLVSCSPTPLVSCSPTTVTSTSPTPATSTSPTPAISTSPTAHIDFSLCTTLWSQGSQGPQAPSLAPLGTARAPLDREVLEEKRPRLGEYVEMKNTESDSYVMEEEEESKNMHEEKESVGHSEVASLPKKEKSKTEGEEEEVEEEEEDIFSTAVPYLEEEQSQWRRSEEYLTPPEAGGEHLLEPTGEEEEKEEETMGDKKQGMGDESMAVETMSESTEERVTDVTTPDPPSSAPPPAPGGGGGRRPLAAVCEATVRLERIPAGRVAAVPPGLYRVLGVPTRAVSVACAAYTSHNSLLAKEGLRTAAHTTAYAGAQAAAHAAAPWPGVQ